ncbi:MAG: sensor histidine kinase [Planctomycetes bacterium]|nr:sensor histidine kinase [Planctomycetota bacterium]
MPAPSRDLNPEQQIAQLQEMLAHTQQLAALGELVSTTTHEFNNVLMTVINYARMGLRHKDHETREKALQKILAAGERAARITASILGMARNRSESFEPTDLAKLIEDTLLLLERELSKYRIRVDRQLHPVPPVLANGNQMQQVLLNLVTNARQAMPRGGELLIRLSHQEAEGAVELLIRDYGEGIPADKLPRIFDPFFSTKSGPDESGKGGTGLGLSAARNIIESHRGKIRVESTVGVGTAFAIKLPIARTPAPVEAGSILPAGQLSP